MTISREQADAMGRLLAAMDEATGGVAYPESEEGASAPVLTEKKGDNALNGILESFRNATDDTLEEADGDHEFSLALETAPTKSGGVRMGSWEISVRQEEGFGKYYDVSHTMTKEPIASDLRLYEAAYGIVKALNEGETFTSPRVKAIVDLENDYARALSDAVNFASRMKITEGMKHDVAEARYGEARRQALTAKSAIEKLTK